MSVTTLASPVDLAASRAYCRRVAKEKARNFYHGMKLVPQPKKSAMYALYAWMREADDLADEPGDLKRKQESIDSFRRETHEAIGGAVPRGELWPAFGEMARGYAIPRDYFDAMIDGQFQDQSQARYKTFDDLYSYCYKVASVVGLACIQIWGYEGGAESRKLAEQRGIAFQLTNILRDVREDAALDRVYLPAEEFGVFDLQPAMFTLGKPGDLVRGLRAVAERARDYYDRSAPLDALVHRDGRACLTAMTRIYRGLLDQILADPSVVLRKRVTLGKARKLWIALRATMSKGGGK